MELAKIIGVGLVTAIAALILKSSKPELAFAVTIAGGVIILIFALDMLGASLRIFTDIAEKTGIDQSLVKIILKIVASWKISAVKASRTSWFWRERSSYLPFPFPSFRA